MTCVDRWPWHCHRYLLQATTHSHLLYGCCTQVVVRSDATSIITPGASSSTVLTTGAPTAVTPKSYTTAAAQAASRWLKGATGKGWGCLFGRDNGSTDGKEMRRQVNSHVVENMRVDMLCPPDVMLLILFSLQNAAFVRCLSLSLPCKLCPTHLNTCSLAPCLLLPPHR